MRTRGSHLVIFFLILAVVAAIVAVFIGKRSRSRSVVPALAVSEPAAPQRTLAPLPARTLSPRLKALRARAMDMASRVRGLDWTGEVGMTELSGWEYGTRTKEIADVLGTEDLKGLSRLAIAGGMLPEGTDLASLAVSFTAATAGATYSPLDKQVLLVSDESQGGFRDMGLLTHEFVHALQDQHFDLLKLMLTRPFSFDRTEAAFALVEGDAVSVERRVQQGEAWSRKTLEQIEREEDARFSTYRSGVGAFFPPLLTETFIFRYRDGLRFVETLRRARPAINVDDAFRRPPVSSEQVLHPEKYLAGETPREVELGGEELTEEGWRLTATTPLGEIGVRGLLMAGVAPDEAKRAAAGWGGDRSFVFEREGHAPLFVWKTVWDTAHDAQEFFRAYNALMQQRATLDATQTDAEREWREGKMLTRVRVEGDAVVIMRGSEADVANDFRLAAGK
jgi:hypothetical protein